jgi:predicted anti-sigma-YlaC factor YlaD
VSDEKIIPGGISCREVVELVTDYLEGVLDPEVEARFVKHLELCPPCVDYVEQIRTTSRLAAAAEFEERPDSDTLLAAFRTFWAPS